MKYLSGHQCQIPHLSEILLNYFGYITDGAFVEVGAFNGYNWSNTWGLIEAGWRGLMIEPQPDFCEECRRRYKDNPRIHVEECCVGGQKAKAIKLFLGGSISTTVPEQVDIYAQMDEFSFVGMNTEKYILCSMRTLNDLLEEHRWPEGFEVLVVDVEGAELDVFAGFDLERWQPQMAIIELHETLENPQISRNAQPVGELFAQHGYKKIYADHINTIFWREEDVD